MEEEVRCGGGVVPMDDSGRGGARKQRLGKRVTKCSAIQFEQ